MSSAFLRAKVYTRYSKEVSAENSRIIYIILQNRLTYLFIECMIITCKYGVLTRPVEILKCVE